ncbi:MAG TPA: Calx-beta domain-containing protein [Thermoanaerobaculia bacterium]|nr:Calx-beta domain-containing protein [Thermoanaerobaculia bacterium]
MCRIEEDALQPERAAGSMLARLVLACALAAGTAVAASAAPQRPARPAPTPPPLPVLAATGATVAEGDSGTSPATFVVTLTPRAQHAVTVEYTTRDGTATAASGDYRGTRGRVELPAGIDSATVDVPVQGDTVEEADETFSLVLRNPIGARLAEAEAQAEIVDDDGTAGPGSGPELSIEDGRLAEGNSGRRTLTLVVTLSAPATKLVTVDYATADGSATAVEDYQERSGKLRFPPGVTSRSVELSVLGDGTEEGDEDLVVTLADPVGAVLGRGSAVALILDDDERGAVTLEPAGSREFRVRAGQVVLLEVRLRSDTGEPITGAAVQWTADGAADLLDGAATTTNRDGRASQRVRVSQSPGLVAIRALAQDGAGFAAEPQTVLFHVTVGQPPG